MDEDEALAPEAAADVVAAVVEGEALMEAEEVEAVEAVEVVGDQGKVLFVCRIPGKSMMIY